MTPTSSAAAGEHLTLLDWIAEALGAQLATDAGRLPGYPSLEEALSRRYGSEEAKR